MAAEGSKAPLLGPNDFHAGYMSFFAPVKAGERLLVRAQFPHCRYISFSIYDQDMMLADSLSDIAIIPARGVNPFLPGVDRSTPWLGEYELQVVMEDPPPPEQRLPNTLYAGRAFSGKPNRAAVLAYRMYLPDKGYGFDDGHPLAVFGGVAPGLVQLYDREGQPYCPSKVQTRTRMSRLLARALTNNLKVHLNTPGQNEEPKNPPLWINLASRENQRASTVVPNDEPAYVIALVSGDLGDLLVLRWAAARTPQQTYYCEPFTPEVDMRYWSLSFAAFDRREGVGVVTERTVADVETPVLPDGTRQLVVGFGGRERPAAVPAEMWVGLKMRKGMIIMRNIQIRPGYEGDFGSFPAGPIQGEHDRFIPGGVYCSTPEFEANPEIGLTRLHRLAGTGPDQGEDRKGEE
jgi:hypothetical protein